LTCGLLNPLANPAGLKDFLHKFKHALKVPSRVVYFGTLGNYKKNFQQGEGHKLYKALQKETQKTLPQALFMWAVGLINTMSRGGSVGLGSKQRMGGAMSDLS